MKQLLISRLDTPISNSLYEYLYEVVCDNDNFILSIKVLHETMKSLKHDAQVIKDEGDSAGEIIESLAEELDKLITHMRQNGSIYIHLDPNTIEELENYFV